MRSLSVCGEMVRPLVTTRSVDLCRKSCDNIGEDIFCILLYRLFLSCLCKDICDPHTLIPVTFGSFMPWWAGDLLSNQDWFVKSTGRTSDTFLSSTELASNRSTGRPILYPRLAGDERCRHVIGSQAWLWEIKEWKSERSCSVGTFACNLFGTLLRVIYRSFTLGDG